MNKQLDILVNSIQKNIKNIDTKDNKKIKDLYIVNKNRAIELLVKDNSNYYYEIVSDFKSISEEYLLGAILDSIYEALEKYELDNKDKTYITLSGIILKNKLINKIKHNSTKKKGGESKDSSFDDIKNKGYDFDNKSVLNWRENLNGYSKFDIIDAINTNKNLSIIQKQIAIMCVKSEGRVFQEDLAKQFNMSQQAISYHLKKIRKEENFM